MVFALRGLSKACAVVSSVLLVGCSTLWPAYEAPRLDLPDTNGKPIALERQWWRAFGDSVLNQLIADALVNNFDLAKAAANVEEARANTNAAAALLSPRVDGVAQVATSQRQLTMTSNDSEFNKTTTSAVIGAAVSWEVDLWGRIRQLNDAARARLAASEHTRNAVDLSVSVAVAETYFQLRTFTAKLLKTRAGAAYLKDVSELDLRRWRGNLGTELAYRQSLAEYASTEARIPGLETAVARTELALKLLVGRTPRQFGEPIATPGSIVVPEIPREFDFSLLLQRPDVASAEQYLQAAHADINAARAENYPRLNLSLLAGFLSSTSRLVSGMPFFYDASAGLMGPIYDAGLVQSKVDGAQARRDKALAHYRYTVSLAFRDAYEAMVLRESGDKQVRSSENEVATRRKSLGLMQKSYEVGRSSKYEVLGESIKVLNAEIALEDARLTQLVARSSFYKALGGGF